MKKIILFFLSISIWGCQETNKIDVSSKDFAYTVYNRDAIFYNKRSAFAVIGIRTNSNQLKVSFNSPLANAGYVEDAAISVFDSNWNFVGAIIPEKTRWEQQALFTLEGSGFRKFYLVEGGNTQDGPRDFKGTYINSISARDGKIEIVEIDESDHKIVTIGDSISIGDGSTINSKDGWVIILRHLLRAKNWSLTTAGWGAAYTLGIAGSIEEQKKMAEYTVRELKSARGRKLVLWVLGTNDFGYVVGDPANVASAAASVWDNIRQKDSGVEIILITPISRINENQPNSGGWILQDYRDALKEQANTRNFVTAYDGPSIFEPNESFLTDKVHPNDLGHQMIAEFIFEKIKS